MKETHVEAMQKSRNAEIEDTETESFTTWNMDLCNIFVCLF